MVRKSTVSIRLTENKQKKGTIPMTPPQTSLFLNILQRAETDARTQEDLYADDFYNDQDTVRGGSDDIPLAPPGFSGGPSTLQPVIEKGTLIDHLDAISASLSSQIVDLQTWLQSHPELLKALDNAMHKEFQEREKRLNRTAIIMNTIFTVCGAILGLLLSPLVTLVGQLFGLH
jgi:hypothetical protein